MKRSMWFGLMAFGLVGAGVASEVRYVDEFDLSGSTCGLGKRTLAQQSVDGHPLTIGGKVSFAELGLAGERWVKDLWRQKCEGRHSGEYFALVPPHATKLVKMRPVNCQKCDEKRAPSTSVDLGAWRADFDAAAS